MDSLLLFFSWQSYQKAIDDYTKCLNLMDSIRNDSPFFRSMVYRDRSEAYTKLGKVDLAAKDKAASIKLGYGPGSK
jgi:hypothetical protein